MIITFRLLAFGLSSALPLSAAMGQSGPAAKASVRSHQKPSPGHAVLAVVTRNDAAIYADSLNDSHAIGACPKGQYLTVTGMTALDYRVLAPHNKRVYVAKGDVKLLGYRVTAKQLRR